jgi:tetratricopeptide (TPR) repeat protein
MLDIDIEEDLTKNQDSYDGLISTIEISQGMLVLIIAACAPGAFQSELIDRYEAELAPSIPSYRIELDRSEPSLRQGLENLVNQHPELQQSNAPAAISVTGAASLLSVPLGDTETNSALDRFFGYLQWTREGLREFPYPIILWVTPQILTRLSAKAPDFWSWRGGVFRFTAPVVVNNNIPDRSINFSFKLERTSDLPIDELLEQVAQIEAKDPNSPTLATLFERLGQTYTSRLNGNSQENRVNAIEYFKRALTIQTKLNLKRSKIYTLSRLGKVYFKEGDYQQAGSLFQDALTIATELEDRSGIATFWNWLGNIARNQGNWDEAKALYQQALKLRTELDDQSAMSNSWASLGHIARDQGNWNEAEALYQQALKLRTELDDQSAMANSWASLGHIARNRGNWNEAEVLYQQSLKLRTELDDRAGMVISLGCLGDIASNRGNYDEAEALYKKCLDIAEDLQMTWHVAETNWDLAQLYRAKGDEPQAQQHYSIAHKLFIKLGAKGDLAKIEKGWL